MSCRTVCGAGAETGARVAGVPLLPLARWPWRLEAVEGRLTCQNVAVCQWRPGVVLLCKLHRWLSITRAGRLLQDV
jgi:hypothetical protein